MRFKGWLCQERLYTCLPVTDRDFAFAEKAISNRFIELNDNIHLQARLQGSRCGLRVWVSEEKSLVLRLAKPYIAEQLLLVGTEAFPPEELLILT